MNKKLREWFENTHGKWAHVNGVCAVSLDKCPTIIGERVSFGGHDCVIVDANTDDVCPYVCLMPTYKNTSIDNEIDSCVHIFFTDYKKIKEGMNKMNKQITKETTTTTAKEPKFKVGDHVSRVDHPEWGMGIVTCFHKIFSGSYQYHVEFTDKKTSPRYFMSIDEFHLLPYTSTHEPGFKVGDSVICDLRKDFGVGVVRSFISPTSLLAEFADNRRICSELHHFILVDQGSGGSGSTPPTEKDPRAWFKKGDRVITGLGRGEITGETVLNKKTRALKWRVFLDEKPDTATSRNLLFDERLIYLIPTQPIGAVPEHRWIDNRIMKLSKAIHDHIDRGQKVPRVWIEELARHLETFNNR